jgi:ribose/xylose/arabinose/galactoside ABC-type transport system permease subunit
MKSGAYRVLQGMLWSFCAFHVIVGLGLNLSGDLPKAMAVWYGATAVNWSGQFLYALKALGAFMFVLGTLAAVAALDPLRHREIAYAFAALFIFRGLQRLVFGGEIINFGIPPERNTFNMVFFFALGVSLFVLHRYVENQEVHHGDTETRREEGA